MIRTVIGNGKDEIKEINRIKNRADNDEMNVAAKVSEIIENIRCRGDKALLDYTLKFDKIDMDSFIVPMEEIEKAYSECDKDFIDALTRAADNIKEYHESQVNQSRIVKNSNGIVLGQNVRALSKVGVYVPGGTAAYPSSVLMNVIPAKVAGVEEIIMVTPPSKDGKVNANILAAAYVARVDRVYRVGGAQAIAALAFGTESVQKVDKIVGPGNIYVATAKKLVYGNVDIDMIAGPSEILIVADETANPEFLAADMLSQAEHDILASAVLITSDKDIALKTKKEIEKCLKELDRKDIAERSIEDYGLIVVIDNIKQAIDLANSFAPEHLELCVREPFEWLPKIKNAGAVFLGNYTPEPIGDYYAGPNHVLPTNGTAAFFSQLSVDSFVKKYSFTYYSKSALELAAGDVEKLALSEGLQAHARSISVRRGKK